ncbi:MAG TPA: class I SAM-dependent methyltransferase [Prolixibacteraceae bacterium]|nr:class I SAM-dependent methyltransferase [Prolixibacteraceae bacterium]
MEKSKVCPWWMGYLLLFPLRKIRHNPDQIAGPFLKPGMKVIDYGSAMGYFSLPMARMVGETGRVYCFDIQPRMFVNLLRRARKAGLEQRIEPRLITGSDRDFEGMDQLADFALLFAVAHEVPDQEALFARLYRMLKPGATLFFAEPPGHVKIREFLRSVSWAEKAGFRKSSAVDLRKLTVLFQKI